MANFPAESFYRATIRQSVTSSQAAPFALKVSKIPVLTTGLLTLSPNTSNEEIVQYSGIDAAALTITIIKRGINPSSQTINTNGTDYNNTTYMVTHSQNDSIRGDVNHLHIIQEYGTLDATKLNKIGEYRSGLPANGVLITNGSGNESVLVGGGFAPTGCVIPFAASTSPAGYLLCDGAAVNRATYATLFSIISTLYGVGDGSTTFNVPNLKGRVVTGLDATQTEFDALGEIGGAKTHTLAIGEIPTHSHGLLSNFGGGSHSGSIQLDSGVQINGTYSSGSSNGYPQVQNMGGGSAHNNLQPYITLNYIIKT